MNISDVAMKFLEVRVWNEGARLVTAPEFKPTSLWQLLGYNSAHAPHCHTSWPIAGIIMPRALKRSSIMFKATSELIERFREHITMDSVIKMLQDTHGMPAIQHDRSQKNFGSSIGFHPAIYKEMIRVVAVFEESHELSSCYDWNCL